MEPQTFICGNTERNKVESAWRSASMEPQTFICGNAVPVFRSFSKRFGRNFRAPWFFASCSVKKACSTYPCAFVTYCYFNGIASFERSRSSCHHPTTRSRPNRKRVIILVTILLRNLSNNHGFTFEGFVFSP